MIAWGDLPLGVVIPFPFASFGASGESLTLTGLAVTDIEVYKGISMTQRSSDAGFALIDTDGIDLDSRTGIHGFSIDTGDNTDAGFYAAGSLYYVVVDAVTINSQTVRFVAGTFRLVAAEDTAGYRKVTIKSGTGTGEVSLSAGAVLLQATQTGVTIPTVTTLTNAPSDPSGVTTLLSRLSSARAGYLDNLSAGAVATAANLSTVAGYIDTEITQILSRLGAWTATGRNTILGAFQALFRKDADATVPSDVNADLGSGAGVAANTTDSLEAVRDRGDAAWLTASGFSTHSAADVWAAGTRTLTALDEDATTLDLDATIRAAVGLASANLDTQLAGILAEANTTLPTLLAALDVLIDGIKAKTDQLVFTTAGQVDATAITVSDKTGYAVGVGGIASTAFAAGAVDAGALSADAATEIVTAVFARVFSAGYNSHTFDELIKIIVAAVAGKASGLATTSVAYRNLADSQDVITATVDADGNRSAVTLTP